MFLLRNSFFFQLCFFIFFTSPLYSELLKNKKFPDSNKLLNVNVGLSTLSAPKYEGSSKSVSRIMPFFNLKYKNITFNPVMGLNVNFLDNKGWLLGYGLGFNFGRDPESDINLNGLKKVNSTFEPKLKAKYKNKYMKFNPAKYLREVRQEVSKVTWPSKRETFTSAGIVLVVISIAAIILMLLDQFFSFIVRIVLG